ncbi:MULTISPECIES: ABC transporter ATP-binding protein [Aneurinibacillus]|uniref:Amino acid/amide ABC transporter ATP-binding protein 1, HAAT family n=1 Tax=Aneurinibacillus thermoaerophilus TaxID=143495 RepID=A0A1G7WZY9_ANETH|nr:MULTISPECIES: ABC transporter ATP-binding protein [Aneurinibacillus]AMA73856.1 ABC transporter ATP-binding protein [Aneurinibacillus sp. XH2]MED0674030.1 ABC transporter ATP-binding protein [Aneurinibacillus thermoaerophilus]MED0678017.1 ABC transporter ATP-binding protein [Aneurinibacillus thermoaerophilus]MED0737793.1 ABC transporter ATP-binding protein [Aneurinibacillus thermoaerophilus]MED0755781.1 ABC transporter ATP-binding protein [Aneurinibacillus thermoaerophilus]
MNQAAPLLEVRNLTRSFGGVMAVHDVSFDIFPGEIVAVIGPNGAGKTTLFNMITAILPATSGSIRFYGQELIGKKTFEIAQMGITRTFQNLQIFDNMSVIENVMTGMHIRGKTGLLGAGFRLSQVAREERTMLEKALEYLEAVGMAHKAYESAAMLPYGNQRLVEIARAVAADPKLILLDEPMAGLNPEESRELVDVILKMRNKGMTFLFVEHDMETVMSTADRIVVLDYGGKIAEGTPEEIYNDPRVIAAYLGDEGGLEC